MQFFLCTWPRPAEGEVMKRGETALRHRIILLPIALWLRTQSPNYRELYLLYSFSLKGVAILSHFPFEVLFQWVANGSNDLGITGPAWEGGLGWWVMGFRLPDWKLLWPLFLGKCYIFSAPFHQRETILKVTLTSSSLRITNPASM